MVTLKNKIIWITGASSGIGEALAYTLAGEQATLILTGRNEDRLNRVRDICLQNTSTCILAPFDLSRVDQLPQLVEDVIPKVGHIDVLINNAGQSQRSWAKETPLENDRRLMELNFFSPVALTKLLLPYMLKQGSGHLVVISSITGKFGFPMRSSYSAAKHALQGYFESLRAELKDDHIAVTIISPGRINTKVSLNALTETGEAYNQMDMGQQNGMPPDKCALAIIRAIKARKKDTLVGQSELLLVYIRKYIPFLYHRLVTKIKN